MDKYLETYNLPTLNHEQIEYLNRQITSKEIELVIQNLSSLAGVAQWIEQEPANQKVTGWIPSQGTCLVCGPGPQ